jgi:hypothetical protein
LGLFITKLLAPAYSMQLKREGADSERSGTDLGITRIVPDLKNGAQVADPWRNRNLDKGNSLFAPVKQ